MELTRYQFELLAYLEKNGAKEYTQRQISDFINISGSQVGNDLEWAVSNNLIQKNGDHIALTTEGLNALEPYRVKRAVILAAGFGSRMVPVTLDMPKPLVRVNGVRIIDTVLDALVAVGITDITLVRGYKKECMDELLEKYPFITLVDNDIYDKTNNISSILAVVDKLDECYICEADLMVSNPDIIRKYQYATNYLGSYSLESDDWNFELENGRAVNYKKGGKYCFNAYGISYWNKKDSAKLRADLKKCWDMPDGHDIFWEFVPLHVLKDEYNVEIRQCQKSDIIEIDNFYELVLLDPSYADYKAKSE